MHILKCINIYFLKVQNMSFGDRIKKYILPQKVNYKVSGMLFTMLT